MKKYDFTRFIIDVNGNVETKRIQTDSEKYLIKNILPKVYDESGSSIAEIWFKIGQRKSPFIPEKSPQTRRVMSVLWIGYEKIFR